MKIALPNLLVPCIHDIAQCLESVQEQSNLNILLWNINIKSTIDLFDEIKPDIVFLHQSQLDSAWSFVCKEFDFKYILIIDNDIPHEFLNSLSKKPLAIITPSTLENNKEEYKILKTHPVAKVAQIHNGKNVIF